MPRIVDIVDQDVVEGQLREMFEKDLLHVIFWKRRWNFLGNFFLITGKVCVGAAIVFDFVAGFYNLREYSFAAGVTNTVGLVSMGYSSFAKTESRRRHNDLASILKKLNFDVPAVRIMETLGSQVQELAQVRTINISSRSPSPSISLTSIQETSHTPNNHCLLT
jgi:hypothetical protein